LVALSEPVWPALIRVEGDPELVYVRDRSAWQGESGPLTHSLGDNDRLIDSTGRLFRLEPGPGGETGLQALDQELSLPEILGLVKAHAAQAGSCCVAKLWAPTIRDAFQIVETFDDQMG